MNSFIGQIALFNTTHDPQGWMTCDGRVLNIVDQQALYSIIGNNFGGDARTTFALPNLVGRVPTGPGPYTAGGYSRWNRLGDTGGTAIGEPITARLAEPAAADAVAVLFPDPWGPFVAMRYCICVNGLYPERHSPSE